MTIEPAQALHTLLAVYLAGDNLFVHRNYNQFQAIEYYISLGYIIRDPVDRVRYTFTAAGTAYLENLSRIA